MNWSKEGDEMVEAQPCEDYSEPLKVTPLAISNPFEAKDVEISSVSLEDGESGKKSHLSPWVRSKFQEFDTFLETPVKGLEELATNFLLVVEEKFRQRAAENAQNKTKGGGEGLQELRSLFSFVNYDSSSVKSHSSNWERALFVS